MAMTPNLKHCGQDMIGVEVLGLYDGIAFWRCIVCDGWRERFVAGSTHARVHQYVLEHPAQFPLDKELFS